MTCHNKKSTKHKDSEGGNGGQKALRHRKLMTK